MFALGDITPRLSASEKITIERVANGFVIHGRLPEENRHVAMNVGELETIVMGWAAEVTVRIERAYAGLDPDK
jgi:hypothetical protein